MTSTLLRSGGDAVVILTPAVAILLLFICEPTASVKPLCSARGCPENDGTGEVSDDWGNGQGGGTGQCTCVTSCIVLDKCCDDYLDVCTPIFDISTTPQETTTESAITTIQEETTTTESAITTTQEETSTAEIAITTTQEETTTAESAITTTQEEITTAESVLTTAQEETTTGESAITTTQEETTTAESAITTTQEETTTAESVLTTAQEETTTGESAITTTQEEIITTENERDCGPFPTWLNIIRLAIINGQEVRYACRDGFAFSDNSDYKTSSCSSSGAWEPAFMPCEEIPDAIAQAVFWKPVEAPGAYFIGSSAIAIVIAELVFLILVDLTNFKRSLSYCVRSIRHAPSRSRRNSGDPEASDIHESTNNTTFPSSSDLSIFHASGQHISRQSLRDVHIELTAIEETPLVAKENIVSW